MRKYWADMSSLQHLSLPDILIIDAWSFVPYAAYAYAVYVVFVSLGLKNLGPFAWLRIYFVSRLVNFFVTQCGNWGRQNIGQRQAVMKALRGLRIMSMGGRVPKTRRLYLPMLGRDRAKPEPISQMCDSIAIVFAITRYQYSELTIIVQT